jgi:putative transposase
LYLLHLRLYYLVGPTKNWAGRSAACSHVLNRGHARETIFHDADDRARFRGLLARYRGRFAFRLFPYCLLGNHVHLLLQFPHPERRSRLLAGLLVAFWHHYRRRYRLGGHLFPGRSKTPALEADDYLLSCGRYIERNPLEAGLVVEPWDYRWSSCRASAWGEPDRLLAANPWSEQRAAAAGRRWALGRAFLKGEDPKEGVVGPPDWVVGGEAFRRRLERRAGRPVPKGRGRPTGGNRGPGAGAGAITSQRELFQ